MRHSIVAGLALVLSLAGCRSMPDGTPTAPRGPTRSGDIISVDQGASLSFEDLMHRVRKDRVVYVGEQHNNDYMHAFQTRVVEAMYAQDPNLQIGMEMFQRPFQEGLDRFIRGEIDEETMLRETSYHERWGWDYHYYRPMLLFARDHGIPVIGLNAPPDARKKLAREGREALTDEERAWVAEEIDTEVEAHREAFMEAVGGGGHAMSAGMEGMYRSQCVWEDTMAESAARALAARPGSRMAVIAGGFHTMRFSIPERAARRGAAPYVILNGMTQGIPADHMAEVLDRDQGDYLYFTKAAPEIAPTPKLGVMLGQATGEGLPVVQVVRGSLAGLAGVKKDDVITGLNNWAIADSVDLKVALTLLEGRIGTITVLRENEPVVLRFDRAWTARR